MNSLEGPTKRPSPLPFVLILLLSATAVANPPSFQIENYPGRPQVVSQVHADINNDGKQDMITASFGADGASPTVTTYIGTGNGGYEAGIDHAITAPNGPISVAVGDIDRDGNADLVVTNGTNVLTIFYGHGDGTFARQDYALPTPDVAFAAVVTDFNRDGKPDIALNVQAGSSLWQVRLFLGTGTRTSLGSNNVIYSQTSQPITQILSGDFDGDAKADLAVIDGQCYRGGGCNGDLNLMFGDGAGGFGIFYHAVDGANTFSTADVNQDGKSDIIASFSNGSFTPYSGLHIYYGNADRNTFTFRTVAAPDPDQFYRAPAVADFNGDRKNDIAVLSTNPTCSGCSTYQDSVYVFDGASNFASFTNIPVQNTNFGLARLTATEVDTSLGNVKPDLVTSDQSSGTIRSMLNNTTGVIFRNCKTSPGPDFVSVCFPPNGGSSASPVQFQTFATSFYALRKIEIWVDGAKKSETYNGFTNEAWSDVSIPLANGTHTATVIAAGYDNRLIKKNVTFTVGGSDATCPMPVGTEVDICSPAAGSTVTSPVQITIQGNTNVDTIEAWVNGTKVAQQFNAGGSPLLNASVPLANGSYTLAVISKSHGVVLNRNFETFTVSGSTSTCSQPSSATATVICSPANGSTVSNPVSVKARGGSSVNFMEVWVDGTKRFQTSGNTVSTSLSLAAGSHKLTVFGRNGTTVLSSAVSTFTVH